MNTLTIIILTLLIYSAISTFVYLISDENEDVLFVFGVGIVGLLLAGIISIISSFISFFILSNPCIIISFLVIYLNG